MNGDAIFRRACAARLLFFLLLVSPSLVAAQATRRPMQFEDLMKMRRLGGIDVSPDGRWVLFTVTDVDLERNTRTPHLWLLRRDNGSQIPITASSAGENGGRFSPDGKQILFVSARDGISQIYLAAFDTSHGTIAEAQRLTHLSGGASGAIWSPNGTSILFTSAVYPDCTGKEEDADACNRRRDQQQADSLVKAKIFTQLLFRHWNQYTGDKRSHLFLVPASGGAPRDLTPGVDHDIPPFSIDQPDAYAFSPGSKEIAFEWNTDPVPATSTNRDIFTLSLGDPGARPIRISNSPGGDFTPRYSPDGKFIAFRSQARAGYESDRFRLMVYDRQAKQIHEVIPGFDRWVDDLAWSPDAKTVYFTSQVSGEEPVFAVEAAGRNLRQITDLGTYGDLHPTADGSSLILTRATVRQPSEISVLRLAEERQAAADPGIKQRAIPALENPVTQRLVGERQLTYLNRALLSQLDLPEMQPFWFYGALRTRVEGFLVKPPNFYPKRKYPVKFLIHGGPEGEWGDSWSYRWNPELFAASGYVVIMINPRGSAGYGQAFVDGVNGDWGGKPYIDLMRGLDYAEAAYPFVDKTRECALGASYGGYMANWILGHTDRFRCIVSHDGMFDTEGAYGATEELWFPEWEFRGVPWGRSGKSRDLYRRWSPALFAANFKTPTLVIHSQLDYRLDLSQGLELFTTLQRRNIPSKMLYFPDEGHWVLKPQNSRLWNKTVSDWCDLYTKSPAMTPAMTTAMRP
jgi:dipeptidyl aminopeptidase/acylaminoacyl peptidase